MCLFKFDGNAAKLSPGALGIAIGLLKGLWLLIVAWAGWLGVYTSPSIDMIQKHYSSYAPTFAGGLYGGLMGFICGFIIGFLIAYFYNLCLRCCKKSSDKK